jgi:hypothetical protein
MQACKNALRIFPIIARRQQHENGGFRQNRNFQLDELRGRPGFRGGYLRMGAIDHNAALHESGLRPQEIA